MEYTPHCIKRGVICTIQIRADTSRARGFTNLSKQQIALDETFVPSCTPQAPYKSNGHVPVFFQQKCTGTD